MPYCNLFSSPGFLRIIIIKIIIYTCLIYRILSLNISLCFYSAHNFNSYSYIIIILYIKNNLIIIYIPNHYVSGYYSSSIDCHKESYIIYIDLLYLTQPLYLLYFNIGCH